jgi:hypothetical protein
MSTEIEKGFASRAEEEFGKDRAEQLRAELEQMAAEIQQLRNTPLEIADEP